MSTVETEADWCVQTDVFAISGTRMVEYSRRSEGIKWCFSHRKRHEFWWVVDVPDGFSYYGPEARMAGTHRDCTDLFPGWYWTAVEE